jgi:hypothetical protein
LRITLKKAYADGTIAVELGEEGESAAARGQTRWLFG